MVHSKEMQHGGVQVVNHERFVHSLVTVLVRGPKNRPTLDAASRQPDGEPEGIVIAAILALREGSASEFPSPNR